KKSSLIAASNESDFDVPFGSEDSVRWICGCSIFFIGLSAFSSYRFDLQKPFLPADVVMKIDDMFWWYRFFDFPLDYSQVFRMLHIYAYDLEIFELKTGMSRTFQI